MPKKIDLVGRRYGRLLVVSPAPKRGKTTSWNCQCDCGSVSVVGGGNLNGGKTKSCGCWNREVNKANHTKHGMHGTPEYGAWCGMISRCHNQNFACYKDYGGRGIFVCDRWRDFSCFFTDVGKRPFPRAELDRINNNAGYEPGNVRWANRRQNMANTRTSIYLTLDGVTRHLKEWASVTGIGYSTLFGRLWNGWDSRRALTTKPVIGGNKNPKNYEHTTGSARTS